MNGNHQPTTAFLALGSNLGDRLANLQGAWQALHDLPQLKVLAASAIYETEPVGGPDGQPAFLNAVLMVETFLEAPALLAAGLAIEQSFGRCRHEHWGPRTLDIDLLLYGDKIVQQQDLVVPHPRLHERAFVLMPLMDLAPDLLHPLRRQTVRDMLHQLPSTAGIRRLPGHW